MFGNVTIVAIIIGRPFFSDKKSVRKRTRPHIFLEKIECVCLFQKNQIAYNYTLIKESFFHKCPRPQGPGPWANFSRADPGAKRRKPFTKATCFSRSLPLFRFFLSLTLSFSFSFTFYVSFSFPFSFSFSSSSSLSLSLSLFLLFFSLSLVFLFFVLSFSLSYCTFIKKTWSGKSDAINMLNPIHHKYYKYYKYYNDHKYQ